MNQGRARGYHVVLGNRQYSDKFEVLAIQQPHHNAISHKPLNDELGTR
jgi:hypothetical protein